MSDYTNGKYKEIIERYCPIIEDNAVIRKSIGRENIHFECLNLHNCIAKGGCRNEKYRKYLTGEDG